MKRLALVEFVMQQVNHRGCHRRKPTSEARPSKAPDAVSPPSGALDRLVAHVASGRSDSDAAMSVSSFANTAQVRRNS